jgi:hypothetical protein
MLTGVTGQVGAALRTPLEARGLRHEADRSVFDLSRPTRLFPKSIALSRSHR